MATARRRRPLDGDGRGEGHDDGAGGDLAAVGEVDGQRRGAAADVGGEVDEVDRRDVVELHA
ncbi:MAG: hypothetical protein ACK595_11405, partial [Planctomycetota bacterium]